MFRPLSGLDWCEWNYKNSYLVAEFFNTVSNLPLIILPLLGLKLSQKYLSLVNPSVRFIYYLMIFVGVASAYYHATLSLFGQLLDELCLLWVSAASFIVWIPSMTVTPDEWKKNINRVRVGALVVAVMGTVMCFVKPALNAYMLIALCGPGIFIMAMETRKTDTGGFAFLVGLMWAVAITIWLSDRLMCSYWRAIGFPYLHALWHVFSSLASYMSVVIFSYFDALAKVPHQHPKIASVNVFMLKLHYVGIPTQYVDS